MCCLLTRAVYRYADNEDVAFQGVFGQRFSGKGEQGNAKDASATSALL